MPVCFHHPLVHLVEFLNHCVFMTPLQLPVLAEALGTETASSELLPLYVQLLRWVERPLWLMRTHLRAVMA